jgi:hypothetical protein
VLHVERPNAIRISARHAQSTRPLLEAMERILWTED